MRVFSSLLILAAAPALAAEWTTEGDTVSVTLEPGTASATSAGLGFAYDFSITYAMDVADVYAGLCFRAHQNNNFAEAEGGDDLGVPGLYGYASCFSPRDGMHLGLSDGTPEQKLAEASRDAETDAEWQEVTVTAEGSAITITLNGEEVISVEDETIIGGEFYWCAVAPEWSDGGTSRFKVVSSEIKDRTGNWRALFNGENFDGWKQWGNEKWDIEDGTIIGRSGPDKSEGYLATTDTWTDFRVRGTFKMLGEGNFGLFYHSTIEMGDRDGKPYPYISGVQGEVEPGYPSSTGWLYESYKRGWLIKPPKDTLAAYVLQPEGWNEIEIRSEEGHVTTWVNGVRAVDFDDSDPQLFEGSFALQLHAGGVDGIAWKELYVLDE